MRKAMMIGLAITSLTVLVLLLASFGARETAASQTGPVRIQALANSISASGVQQDPIAREIFERRFGLTIDFIFTGDRFEERLATEMSSGRLPDLIQFGNRKQAETAIEANLLHPLDDLLPQYGRNIVANMPSMVQYLRDNLSNGSGRLFGITNYVGSATFAEAIHLALYTRWDLFNSVGAPRVNTYMELLPVLRQMLDLEPTNAQGQRNYAFSLWGDWDSNEMVMLDWSIINYRGINNSQDNGTLAFTQYDQETKILKNMFDPDSAYMQALEFYYRANQLGLLDPDSITQKFDNVMNKLNEGRLLTAYWGWMAGSFNGSPLAEANPRAGMVPVFPMQEARLMLAQENTVGREFVWAIGAQSNHASRILSLLDFATTVTGSAQIMNGVEGVDWNIVNGKAQFLGNNLELFVARDPAVKHIGLYEAMCILSPWNVDPRTNEQINRNSWSQVIARKARQSEVEWAQFYGAANPFEYAARALTVVQHDGVAMLTSTPPDDIKVIQQRLAELTKAQSWRMIFAANDSQFAQLKNELMQNARLIGSDRNFEWARAELARAAAKAATYATFSVNL